jgi:8-oxo-dGTP pyrophosphatase MutT (NUDIX family)
MGSKNIKTKKSISVWLALEDGEDREKIVVQKRSPEENHFPYLCQATWSGKIDDLETVQDAVKRECIEELGRDFAEGFNFSGLKFLGDSRATTNGISWICSNYFGTITESILKTVKMHKDAFSEFLFISQSDPIYPLKSKQDPKKNLVFFDDQYKVLKHLINAD